MQLLVLGAKASQTGSDQTTPSNVLINFRVSELFGNVNAANHDCSIKVLFSDAQTATTPEALAALAQNQLVSELNSGQLVLSWTGYNFNRTGTTIDSVDINFTTFDANTDNAIVLNDALNIPYAQFQTDMASGVSGLLADVKNHLITEFTPAS